MTCSNCGTELKDGYKFCLKCGTPVTYPEEPKESISEPSDEAEDKSLDTTESSSVKESSTEMDGLEEKLSKLHDLFSKELIDADEYKKAKAKLLGI